MILLDSSTLIHYIRGVESVVRQFQGCSRRELRIPSIVAYEIGYGAAKTASDRRRAVTSRLLAGIVQVPFDAPAAAEAARIRLEVEERGLVIGPLDLLIAGTARSRGALLVTGNTAEFSRVPGLRLADWTAPEMAR